MSYLKNKLVKMRFSECVVETDIFTCVPEYYVYGDADLGFSFVCYRGYLLLCVEDPNEDEMTAWYWPEHIKINSFIDMIDKVNLNIAHSKSVLDDFIKELGTLLDPSYEIKWFGKKYGLR